MSLHSVPVLLAALCLAAAGQAYAQPDDRYAGDEIVVTPQYAPPGAEVRREWVRFADLDLGTRAGAATLLGRISAAAKQVCSPEPVGPGQLADTADYRDCYGDAVARAVDTLDEPTLNDVYRYGAPRYARAYSYSRSNDSGY